MMINTWKQELVILCDTDIVGAEPSWEQESYTKLKLWMQTCIIWLTGNIIQVNFDSFELSLYTFLATDCYHEPSIPVFAHLIIELCYSCIIDLWQSLISVGQQNVLVHEKFNVGRTWSSKRNLSQTYITLEWSNCQHVIISNGTCTAFLPSYLLYKWYSHFSPIFGDSYR